MSTTPLLLTRADLDRMIEILSERGYHVVGPTVRKQEHIISYGEISSTDDLPIGIGDEQEAARYRLVERGDGRLFGYVLTDTSPISFLLPSEAVVWSGKKSDNGFETAEMAAPPRLAFIGTRPCELAAVAIQDKVFLGNGHQDPTYAQRRAGTFFVSVDCTEPGGTCFCDSMGTGPGADGGFDIGLIEVLEGDDHYFVARSGSDEGAAVLSEVGGTPADDGRVAKAAAMVEAAAGEMGRTLDTEGLKEILAGSLDDPIWKELAGKCLTCANCTMVCPTCFCAAVENRTNLDATEAERVRRWDSCFNFEFSYIHGGPLRPSAAARYRQWMTHKLSSWVDQFGMLGCVGCGRCITWCPVGIDITANAAAIRARMEEKAHV
ncbi:MAG: 4Fe-4S dicluster domain-containing protein [Actinobacteria bacterium]|nr:4Fe-4S dicluster domain-containing protein [Actinomycetota bacterium]MBU1493455.1 4Fe-4S dicluster domain-containing protein [Actinomycetota bacterium]